MKKILPLHQLSIKYCLNEVENVVTLYLKKRLHYHGFRLLRNFQNVPKIRESNVRFGVKSFIWCMVS